MTQGTTRVRETLVIWEPVWDKVTQGWAAKFIRANRWRCDPINGFDDLMQEAWMVFDRVKDAYPRVIEPRHFMALYKVALGNYLHDKSRNKQKRNNVLVDTLMDVSDLYIDRIGELSHGGQIQALIDEMPEELKIVLSILTRPKGRLRLDKPKRPWYSPLREKETLNDEIRRKVKFKAGTAYALNPVGELLSYLTA